MNRFAQVRGGVVVYVAEAASAPGADWVDCSAAQVGPGQAYNGSTFSAPPDAGRKIRATAFWARFSAAEREAYDVAAQHNSGDSAGAKQAAARLRIFEREAYQRGSLQLTDPDVVAAVSALEASGVIAAGRAAEILGAPVSGEEVA